ncbi:hypothetical protein [Desulfotignum balticum]|jgi:hypothetical protein|uniref:hypothetical protein n=1 Tax=Desulfotignum balticum TaxID=115781 RepID=UPI0003FA6321|nr:hypothetical protein [Desulfotignum balticum]
MRFEFSPKEVLKLNLYLILFLLCANVLGIISKYYFDHDYVYGLIPLFDFSLERNIPTLYSSIALVFVSILLSLIGFINKKLTFSYLPWFGLALIFLFLSIDEIHGIHENLTIITRNTFNMSGFFYYAWVLPYSAALMVFMILYLKFLFDLPKPIMILFLVSGSIFVSGAIGFELLGGRQAELYGKDNVLYCFFYTCEELLEMLGVAVFIYTLLRYMVEQFKFMAITVANKKEA